MLDKLPACYFPTTTLLVDDNINFLQNLAFELGNDISHFRLFNRPQDVIEFFNTEYQPPDFLKQCIDHVEDDLPNHRALEVNVSKIQNELYNANRFNLVTTLVIDYAMPGLSGAAVAEQLQHLPINIILLTGEASHENALKLFNSGIIQHYIQKDATNVVTELTQAIERLQRDYFTQLSAMIVDSIIQKSEQHDYLSLSCLNDPIFMRFFYNIIAEHNIREFYLLEESGSFLCVKANGELNWLLVKQEADMEALADELNFPENDIPKELAVKIQNRQVIRHILDPTISLNDPHNWENVLFPATSLAAKTIYYCSYVTEPPQQKCISTQDIVSYNQFLMSI